MINCSELRIGNIVLYAQDNDALPVLKIDGDRKMVCLDLLLGLNMELSEQDIDPIPLTPEWLERCGLTDKAGNGCGYRMDINSADELCRYMDDGFLRYQTIGSGFTRQLQHIKSVHQLQNWFYFFTGKELEIK